MLNLEETSMAEANSLDDDNSGYALPNDVYEQLQLRKYRLVCCEVVAEELYISSYQVASDRDCLTRHKITHIVNTAADICNNCFPDQFKYLTYFLKDSNSEQISLLFYRTLEWIHAAVTEGGRVLVHCKEGVSRSATIVMAYLMWRFEMSFDSAHETIRKVRPICNPNTGFICQLLVLGKRLGLGSPNRNSLTVVDRPALYRVAPYHPRQPFLLLFPVDPIPAAPGPLDPRFGWVAQHGTNNSRLSLWLGPMVPDGFTVHGAVEQHARWADRFETRDLSVTVLPAGAGPAELWCALGFPEASTDANSSVAPQSCYDADYELLLAAAAAKGDCHPKSF